MAEFYVLGPGHILIPTTAEEWALSQREAHVVKQEDIAPGVWISTIFLGLDHRYFDDGPPLVFETMVFREDDGGETFHWSTWDEAIEGHETLAAGLRALVAQTPEIRIGGTVHGT